MCAVLGCAMSGLIADSRTMVEKARVEAQVSGVYWSGWSSVQASLAVSLHTQNYWFTYNEPMSVESVTQSVSNLALRFSEDDDEDEDGMVGMVVWDCRCTSDIALAFPTCCCRAVHLEQPSSWQGWMKVAHTCSTWTPQGPSQSFMLRQ